MKFLLKVLLLLFVVSEAAPEQYLIKTLPGFTGTIPFKQYAGLLPIDASKGRKLFFWFCESQRDPSNDPLLLWLNGGPGSSSLIGFFTEHGFFRPNSDGITLSANNFSWNRIANILYVESPVLVGFSQSDDPSDIKSSDEKVSAQNYDFLIKWMELFPEYSKHKLYLTGESYAGHYIPNLAEQILNKDTSRKLNVVGMMLGNPVIHADGFQREKADPEEDAMPYIDFQASHGFVSDASFANAVDSCGWGNYFSDCLTNWTKPTQKCLNAVQVAINEIPKDIDYYNVEAPICLQQSLEEQLSYTSSWSWSTQQVLKKSTTNKIATNKLKSQSNFDPCLQKYMVKYLNQPSVQEAIHVPKTNWSKAIELNYEKQCQCEDMSNLLQSFFKHPRSTNWRILYYSGDIDSCISFRSTAHRISCLGRPIVQAWKPWHYQNQIAGFSIVYDKISFVTIHSSGHMVPFYTPELGFEFYQKWIEQQSF